MNFSSLLAELAACEKRLIACIEGVPAKCSVNCQNAFGGFTAPATDDKMSSTKPSLTTSTTIYGAPVFDQYCDADLGDNAMELVQRGPVDIERIDLRSGALAGCYGEQSARGHTPSSFNDDLGASLDSVANSSVHGGHGSVLPHLMPICAGTSRIHVPDDRSLDYAEDFDTNHLDKGCVLFGGVRASREEVAQARCDNTKLVIKQALAEANTAKDSLELAGGDNTHFNGVHRGQPFETLSNPSAHHRLLHASVDNVCLNDVVPDRESALQNLRLEYECVRVSEVTAQGRLKELNSILAATTTATACSTPTSTKCSMRVLNHGAYSVPNLPVVCIVGGSNFPSLRGFEAICTSTARPRSSRRSTSSSSIAQPHPQAGAVGSSESELAAPSSVHDNSVALISFSGRCDYARANEMTSAQIDAMAQDETDEIANTVEQLTGLGVEKVVAEYKFRDPKTSDQEMLESICSVLMPLKLQAKIAKAKFEAACSGKISCADIVAFTASDASYFLSNDDINFTIPAGRYDGTVSITSETLPNLPPPFAGFDQLVKMFADKGDRLPSSNTSDMDPSFAAMLQTKCKSTNDSNNTVMQDFKTPDILDNRYYKNVLAHKVLFTPDVTLTTNFMSNNLVQLCGCLLSVAANKGNFSAFPWDPGEDGAVILGVLGCSSYPIKTKWLNYHQKCYRLLSKVAPPPLGSWHTCCVVNAQRGGDQAWMQPLVHDLGRLNGHQPREIQVSSIISDPISATLWKTVEQTNSSHSSTTGPAQSVGFKQPWPSPMEFECLDCAWPPATWRIWSAT
jgi:hypothetical protein|eukprot:XP_008665369.1 uncharacterized protein LOC103643974 [Zea mays]